MSGNIGEKIYRRNEDIVTRKIAGELFLVPIRGKVADMQRIFTLNPVAEYVWQEIDKQSLNEIRKGILAQFDVEKERADADISEFIAELLEAELIRE
jgi:hypothetical protein